MPWLVLCTSCKAYVGPVPEPLNCTETILGPSNGLCRVDVAVSPIASVNTGHAEALIHTVAT